MLNRVFRFSLPVFCLLLLCSFVADKPAYRLYKKGGKAVEYKALLKEAEKADVVLFGEMHNNPIAHWLQLELAKDLHKTAGENLVLGGEMFEADNQVIINEFLQSQISEKSFESEARLWPNYRTDYKPLMQFAFQNKLPFIATNVPRRYASLVSRQGQSALLDLAPESKVWLPALPYEIDYELPGYKAMLNMFGSGHGGGGNAGKMMIEAQALKDATMAANIAKAATGKKVLHFNGAYHSDNFEGIVWYLHKLNPGLKILTITTVEVEAAEKPAPEHNNKADYIIAVPESMTKTH